MESELCTLIGLESGWFYIDTVGYQDSWDLYNEYMTLMRLILNGISLLLNWFNGKKKMEKYKHSNMMKTNIYLNNK